MRAASEGGQAIWAFLLMGAQALLRFFIFGLWILLVVAAGSGVLNSGEEHNTA